MSLFLFFCYHSNFIEKTKCNAFLETKAQSLFLTFINATQKQKDILFNTQNPTNEKLKVIGNQGN
jgi:hypothetical protein